MPAVPIAGKVYRTTPGQRARAAARRATDPERSRAYAKAQTERRRSATATGPRRPRGRPPSPGPTQKDREAQERAARRQDRQHRQAALKLADVLRRLGRQRQRDQVAQDHAAVAAAPPADRSEAARRGHETRRASFVGPPKPEAIATAQRRALGAERQRLKMARVRAEFVGPPRPRGKHSVSLGLPKPPRTTRTPKVPKTPEAHQAATQARELVKAAREWDTESCRVIRRTVVALQKLRTAERRRAWQQEYDRKRSMSDEEREALRAAREAAQAKLNAAMEAQNAELLARLEGERQEQERKAAERAQQRASAEAQASALVMSAPVRRVAFTRPTTPSTN